MQYSVYYLYSTKLNKYYIGKTNNLDRRIMEHNLGQEKFTKGGVPWKLVSFIPCASNKDACGIEKKLKKSKNPRYTKKLIEKIKIGK